MIYWREVATHLGNAGRIGQSGLNLRGFGADCPCIMYGGAIDFHNPQRRLTLATHVHLPNRFQRDQG